MSDLRESGSIEQDADVVTMLHRESYYHMNDPDWMAENEEKHSLAELIVAKQRNGPTAAIKLTWESTCTRFFDWTDATPPSEGSYATVVPHGSSKDPFADDDFSDLSI